MSFLKLIRFPNLVIIVLTQYLLQYLVLIPAIKDGNLIPILDHLHFAFLVLTTVLIAAGGYIINDLRDYQIDILNKPNEIIINRKISDTFAKKIYWLITILGFLISFYLAFYVKNLCLVLIYPAAVLLLFLYSNSLKKSTLWGNLIVSLFSAFVAGVVIFAERENALELNLSDHKNSLELFHFFNFYIAFAFLTSLFREIIKDIEDIDGDQKNGCKTLPIVAGINIAKGVSITVGLILIFILFLWNIYVFPKFEKLAEVYLYLGIIAPIMLSIWMVIKAKKKKQFHNISQLLKFIMLSGILYLLILTL